MAVFAHIGGVDVIEAFTILNGAVVAADAIAGYAVVAEDRR